jgi:hypothetical protein
VEGCVAKTWWKEGVEQEDAFAGGGWEAWEGAEGDAATYNQSGTYCMESESDLPAPIMRSDNRILKIRRLKELHERTNM